MNDEKLHAALRERVAGDVAFDAGTRALYSMDASNYRVMPGGVVRPRDEEDILATLRVCAERGATVVTRGGGTSIAGNAIGGDVVLDTSRHMNRILEIDPDARVARVQPGVVLDDLQAAAAPYGLRFGPDPSTHSRCTLGGMIGNNACGSHSVAWGKTADNVESLDVALPDGTRMKLGGTGRGELDRLAERPGRDGSIYAAIRDLMADNLAPLREQFPALPRRVSGYGLDHLLPEHGSQLARALVGSEGTCVAVLGATVRLVELPRAKVLLVLGYPDDVAAAEAAAGVREFSPLTVEGMNVGIVDIRRRRVGGEPGPVDLPQGKAWLFVEVGGDGEDEATEAAHRICAGVEALSYRVVAEPAAQRSLWRLREEGSGLATRLGDGSEAWPGWEDTAVRPERLGRYLTDLQQLLSKHGLAGLPYGHFGDGCLHIRINFDFDTKRGIEVFRAFSEDLADCVVGHGGSLSGEHGDGRARAELLSRMYGEDVLDLFGRFKAIWDPDDRMNPGVLVRPHRIDDHLRFAALPRTAPRTMFALASDGGDFAKATRRCVGVGKCRADGGGVMCPSYRVTREEKHSTRGRAHLLFEMLSGRTVTGGWRSKEVRDALDLCLSCKGCKSDCPVEVDMAAYKAEFLHHHYAGRIRPASHYSMGFLPVWARLAALAPDAVNAVGRSSLAAPLKRLAGVATQRELPMFASPFTRRFGRPSVRGRKPVLLWPDTFTNYLAPHIADAAVAVLRAAGFTVHVPRRPVCCGLTWVSTGQLGMARRVMRASLRAVEPYLNAGVPVVGLEPSCTAALRDDMPELADDARAHRLAAGTYTLAGLLAEHAPDWRPPRLEAEAISQVHCHQHAVLGFDAERDLLAKAGVRNTALDSGCCGLAGNFGFERGHYDVSVACAERALAPAVREAGPDTLVIADGFSCRTQVSHTTGRESLHLAEVLRNAMR